MGKYLLALLLIVGAAPALAEDLEMRVFALQYRTARDAAAVIEPLLSPDGTILLQPHRNSITVRDRAEALNRIAETIQRWDSRPASYRLRVSLLLASESGPGFNQSDQLLKEISSGLAKLFGFRSCAELDTLRLTANDGDSVATDAVGGTYLVRFTLTASPQDRNHIQLRQFEVLRRSAKTEVAPPRSVLSTANINLAMGQTSILGLAREEKAPQALVVVLLAESGAAR